MKKTLITGVIAACVVALTSCGGGHTCDAYRTSDYTKYKADMSKKVELNKAGDTKTK